MSGIFVDAIPALIAAAKGNSTFNTAMGGRIYYEQAQSTDGSQVPFPYAVLTVVNERPDYTFTSDYSILLFQWSIFDSSSSVQTMGNNVSTLHTVFDDASISISNWTRIRIAREGFVILPPDENGIRNAASTYRLMAQKS